jgi:hypothetical protein
LGADADEGVLIAVEGDGGKFTALGGAGIGALPIILRGSRIEVRGSLIGAASHLIFSANTIPIWVMARV